MEFNFDKFVDDIDKRSEENSRKKRTESNIVDLDRARRLRAKRYHERWQNCIKWERK